MKKILLKNRFSLLLSIAALILLAACNKKNEPIPVEKIPETKTPIVPTKPKLQAFELGYGFDLGKGYPAPSTIKGATIDPNKVAAFGDGRVIIAPFETGSSYSIAAEDFYQFGRSISVRVSTSFFKLFKSSASFFDTVSLRSDQIIAAHTRGITKSRLRFNAPIEILRQCLTDEFKTDLENLPPRQLISLYGTHFATDVLRGGALKVAYRARTSSSDRKGSASLALSMAMDDIFDISISPGTNYSSSTRNMDERLDYLTIGGNSSIALVGELELGPNVSKKISIAAWQNSIDEKTSQFIDIGSPEALIEISELAPENKRAALRDAVRQHLLASQSDMVNPPSIVFQYVDGVNGDYKYSLLDVPSLDNRFFQRSPSFRAWPTQQENSVAVYRYYSPSWGDFILTTDPDLRSGDYGQREVAFYAFKNQAPGTVRLFEFVYHAKINKKIFYTHYYSTSNQLPAIQDWAYISQSLWVYPL